MKERFNSVDLFKFLMAIVVVAIHTNPFVNCKNVLVDQIAIIIEDAAVPFFFMASGFLLALGWGGTSQQREMYIQRTLVSAVRLYITWTLISIPLTLYGYAMSGNSLVSCIFSYVKYFLFVGKLYNSYHLWYLLAMIYALLAMWIWVRRGKGTRYILITGAFFYAVYLVFMWIRQNDNANGMMAAAGNAFYFVFNNGIVFTGMLYMGIGIYIREHRGVSLLTSTAGMAAGILVRYGLSQEMGKIIFAVMLFTFVLKIPLSDCSCYSILRGLSKYIYLVHLLCFSFYTIIVIKQPNKLGIDSFFMTAVSATVLAAIILYGKKRRKGEGYNKA